MMKDLFFGDLTAVKGSWLSFFLYVKRPYSILSEILSPAAKKLLAKDHGLWRTGIE